MFDVIVVGGRCGGASTALLLARLGVRVLLLDRSRFPSDRVSTHTIQLSGLARLDRWGLLDRVRATDCPPIRRITLDFGDFTLAGSPPAAGRISDTLCCRRLFLDAILLQAAIDAGVEVREGFSVSGLIFDTDRVVGIRGGEGQGRQVEERAPVVVGADGPASLVARAARAASYHSVGSLSFSYYSYWEGLDVHQAELFIRDCCAMATLPTNHGLTIVVVQRRIQDFPSFRSAIEVSFMRSLDLVPKLAERVRSGARVERFRGTSYQPNFLRTPWGPGWVLVGDAGCHKDSITAQGIGDAFCDAEMAVDAIWEALSGRQTFEMAMRQYHGRRDERVRHPYWRAVSAAQLETPSGDSKSFLRALATNQEQADRFLGLDAGTVAFSDFYSPENLRAIWPEDQAKVMSVVPPTLRPDRTRHPVPEYSLFPAGGTEDTYSSIL